MNEIEELREINEKLEEEKESWKTKYKALELKKRESDLSLNKIKTEINSLRSVDKQWKDSAKAVYHNLNDVKQQFDTQMDQVLNGMTGISKAGERVSAKIPYNKKVKEAIAALQSKIIQQEESIMSLNGKIRILTAELKDKTNKVERLSQGIEEEVDRLIRPMRDKLADAMVMVMKEKAGRAQDRREIADLWPADHLLPSNLMKYRALTSSERERRVLISHQTSASFALALEVRANVVESRSWEIKYDDYGRAFYQHVRTAEVSWDPPEILEYKPPPGRDDMGNLLQTEEGDSGWVMKTDNRGQVFYEKLKGSLGSENTGYDPSITETATHLVTFIPPYAYRKVPTGKTKETVVGEAAALVLSHIRDKITKHIERTKKLKNELENPLTAEELRKKEKEDRNKSVEEKAAEEAANLVEVETIPLTEFQYDIETVEMLAGSLNEILNKANADKDPEVIRGERRAFLSDSAVRTSFDKDLFFGRTVAELDMAQIDIPALRGFVEELALQEEKLEKQTERVRSSLKEFSFVLMDKITVHTAELAKQQAIDFELREKERKAQVKVFRIEQKKLLTEKRDAKKERLRQQQVDLAAAETERAELAKCNSNAQLLRSRSEDKNSVGGKLSVDALQSDDKASVGISNTDLPATDGDEELEQDSAADVNDDDVSSIALNTVGSLEEGMHPEDVILPPRFEDSDDETEFVMLRAHEDEDARELAAALLRDEMTTRPTDYGSILFGDPVLLGSEPDASQEMIDLSSDLVNFAVFCGFNNLHSTEAPHDSNLEYSLQQDLVDGRVGRDDDWLSSSFFLSVSQETLSQMRKNTSLVYNATDGVLPIGSLDSELLVFQSINPETSFERMKDKPYTPSTGLLESRLQSEYRRWRDSQLMGDVLRGQIQKQALIEAQVHRLKAFNQESSGEWTDERIERISNTAQHVSRVRPVQLRVQKITFDKLVRFASITENLYYIQMTMGQWTGRTHSLAPTPHQFVWEDFGERHDTTLRRSATLPVNDLQIQDLQLELLDENPNTPDAYFIASTRVNVARLLGCNLGREVVFTCELAEKDSLNVVGTISITVSADSEGLDGDDEESTKNTISQRPNSDPHGLNALEMLRQNSQSTSLTPMAISTRTDLVRSNPSTEAHRDGFTKLVGDLRGDGVSFIRQMIGDVTVSDLAKAGHQIGSQSVKSLPDFSRARIFLRRKVNMHRWDIDALTASIVEFHAGLEVFLQRKNEAVWKQCSEMRLKHKKLVEVSEDLKKEVLRIQKVVFDTRKPFPAPREPVLPELPPVPYVPKLPVTGFQDKRGKKKKQIPPEDLKVLLKRVEDGELDGIDLWPYPEANWPSQAQQLKLSKATTARNILLDALRDAELEQRAQITELYHSEVGKWEVLERRRNVDLEKSKRDCRKINLKFEYHMERANRVQKEFQALEANYNCVKDLQNMNAKAKDRYRIMRFKQTLEYTRQQDLLDNIKKRLLKALRARRHALDLPSSATDPVHFEKLAMQSEEALRVIQLEVFDCKQLLTTEGARLRTLFHEELTLCQSELARVKISREILNQRECFDKILERYKFDVLGLMLDMEKLRIAESDKDEVGVDTVDDLGEKYITGKLWVSPEIVKCQRLVDICMAKINLTEGLGNSTVDSQRAMLEVLAVKWGADFLPLRDSWVEHSDFERAQKLLYDTIQYVTNERQKLEDTQRAVDKDKVDLRLQLEAMTEQKALAVVTHELETKTINVSSTEVISVMRDYLDDFRQESKGRIDHLEGSIVNLSRECQKVREDLLAQEMLFDEKVKVLWAFIHTLQTAVQQLSVRMEMILEEREQIVIQSKLVADKMRHQLRIERKHCSNLMFIIHSQRGFVRYLQDVIKKLSVESTRYENEQKIEKSALRKEIWEQLFCFTRLCTDVDALFEFFAARLANLAGSRSSINNALAKNNAAMVLSALCKSPRPLIRKCAARALGGMGWDGFVETRILMWDCVMYWKMFKAATLAKEQKEFQGSFERFDESGKYESILNIAGEVEEFVPSGNMSLRTIIKQRRQWALRAARRSEGPNVSNQRLLNIKDGVIPSLLEMSLRDGDVDWEIARNAALAISIASYEPNNHHDMTHNELCVTMIISMCQRVDAEVQTHAAVTVANLCHKDEAAQLLFGKAGAVEALINMLGSGIVDVLEAATSALANITCFCDTNCKEVIRLGGVKRTIRIITHAYSENLLDLDQNDEVQANAAEMLANVSRFSTDDTVGFFDGVVVDALVLMCASQNKQLRRHIPLVLGNIAQSEACRFEVGVKGGVEALFLVLEDSDTTIQANALWSLCNLMWHPPNQERAGRFMGEIIEFLSSEWEPVRTCASTLLANVLYYNNTNRVRFLESEGAMELILGFVQQRRDVSVVEGSLRALLSLSYLDSVAMWLGVDAGMIPLFIGFLISPLYSRESMRYSLEILCNLCLHHANRRIIYDNGGIDAIVSLHIDNQPHIRDLSVSIIGHLEDITPAEVLARVKVDIGLERMVTLAASQDPLVRAVAAESIGEEIWSDPRKQRRAHEIGGVDVLLSIIANKDEPVESVLPALHSLRNIIQNNVDAQSQFSYRDGLSVVAELIRKGFSGFFAEQTEKVLEAALHCLKFGVLNHERNSRKLLMVGLDAVMDVAEGPTSAKAKAADAYVRQGLRSEGVVALAKDIQLILGEYNYVVCRHCGKRQNLHGTTCLMCGYRLLVEVDQTDAAFLKTLSKLSPAVPLSGTAGVGIAAGAVAKLTDSSSRKSMNSKHPAMRHLAASASMPDIVPFVGHKTLPSGERAEQLTGLGGDEIKKKRSLASSSAKEQLSQTTR